MGTGHRAQNIVGVFYVGHPVANGFGGGVFEGASTGTDGLDRSPHQPHAKHVEGLTLHVMDTHVDHAVNAKPSADRGGGHPVLTGTGFCNDALFAHAFGK